MYVERTRGTGRQRPHPRQGSELISQDAVESVSM